MSTMTWKKGERTIFEFQAGDVIQLQDIAIKDFNIKVVNGKIVLSDSTSSLTIMNPNAALTWDDIGKLKFTFSDGSYFSFIDYHLFPGMNKNTTDGVLIGSSVDNQIWGTTKSEVFFAGDGNDLIYTGGGNDRVFGGAGLDFITALLIPRADGNGSYLNTTPVYIDGGEGNDILIGSMGNDTIIGGGGDDRLDGETGSDYLDGGDGDDTLNAREFYDNISNTVIQNAASSILIGGNGNDTLYSGSGNDKLDGGAGNDWLDGGTGINYLDGGLGDDKYWIRSRFGVIKDAGGTDSAIVFANWVKPSSSIEYWAYVDGVQKLPYWIDALTASDIFVGKAEDQQTLIKVSFAKTLPAVLEAKNGTGFTPFTDFQIAYARKIFAYLSWFLNVKFVEVSDPSELNTIVIGNNTQAKAGGYTDGLYSYDHSAIMINPKSAAATPENDEGAGFYKVFLQEIGHALGLKNPFNHNDSQGNAAVGPFLPSAEESKEWTVMSDSTAFTPTFESQYSPFDIAALQYIFGVSTKYQPANNLYKLSSTSTNFIYDGAGTDTIDGSSLTQALTLYLEPGYWSYIGKKADLISSAGQITINFGTTIENATGTKYDDKIFGNEANNVIIGGEGNDTLSGGAGNDVLIGGVGLDTAIFDAKRSDYSLIKIGTSMQVKNQVLNTTTQLDQIERINFADQSIAFDIDGGIGQVYRLYQAAFNREPDMQGLGYWIKQVEQGTKLEDIAKNFLLSQEFQALMGNDTSNSKIVENLYKNVLHRDPDQAGYDYWLGEIDSGRIDVAHMLMSFSESAENMAQVIGSIQNGINFIPWLG